MKKSMPSGPAEERARTNKERANQNSATTPKKAADVRRDMVAVLTAVNLRQNLSFTQPIRKGCLEGGEEVSRGDD